MSGPSSYDDHLRQFADHMAQVRTELPNDQSVPPSHRPNADGRPGRTAATTMCSTR